ncbi:MAG: 2,3-bisphosphoglycerate-independent phosphoglycerate mutase [Planctomycetota bacterium]
MSEPRNRPLVVVIRDGWGENPNPEHDAFNAIKLARTPVADRLDAEWPRTLIGTCCRDVGLPDGTMGNSEVGHQNIGAGRIVNQEAVRISVACDEGLERIETLRDAVRAAKDNGKAVHLMGLASDAGVHALLDHLFALLRLCKLEDQPKVYLHLFTDGRDTGPFTGKGYIEQVEAACESMGVGAIASLAGRYWAMDRDFRWERVKRAYDCLTGLGDTPTAPSATAAIQAHYDQPESQGMRGDEFVPPVAIGADAEAIDDSRIAGGDTVIFYNYRGDRPRELCMAFTLPKFEGAVKPSPETGARGFDRGDRPDLRFVIMTRYSEELGEHAEVAFAKPPKMDKIAGAFWSELGLTQFRCAETEKYPHVTFFFNDYRDEPFEGERREIIQSPKDVQTYDEKPEMSAHGVRDAVLRRLDAGDCEDVIIVNFANGDMVGHTGSLEAAIKACETTDACVGQIIEKTLARGGSLIVTADHGNAEQMWSPENDAPHTAHTLYSVPLYVVGDPFKDAQLREGGRLADVVPTALAMMGIEQPGAMTGQNLIR